MRYRNHHAHSRVAWPHTIHRCGRGGLDAVLRSIGAFLPRPATSLYLSPIRQTWLRRMSSPVVASSAESDTFRSNVGEQLSALLQCSS